MGDIQFKHHMSEGRPLPGRAENPGKRTSPWLDRFVLIGFLIIAYEVSDEVLNLLEPEIGVVAIPISLIGLFLTAVLMAEQILILIEKMRGIR